MGERPHRAVAGSPPLDFQEHLRLLEGSGLVIRIERAIDKDRELHLLVRWQFQSGLAEHQRRDVVLKQLQGLLLALPQKRGPPSTARSH